MNRDAASALIEETCRPHSGQNILCIYQRLTKNIYGYCFYWGMPEHACYWQKEHDLAFFDLRTGELIEVYGNYMPLLGLNVMLGLVEKYRIK